MEYANKINISINGSSTGANIYTHSLTTNTWYHLCATYDGTIVKLYLNGNEVMSKTASTGSYTTAASAVYIGGTSSYYLNGYMNDARYYDHCLSSLEVKQISQGLVLHYNLSGNLLTSQYDKHIYTEPDGSLWTRIFHHNNPNGSLFTSTDTFSTGVYKDVNRWYDVEGISNSISKYEFMVKQKTTSSASEIKYRWIQTKSPLNSTWIDVQPSAVTRITTSGYTDGTYGGIYKNTGSSGTRMIIANGNSGNWYGATGCWTAYNSGIPGYPNTVITTGYMDLYVRIDNLNQSGTIEYDSSGFCNNGTRTGTFSWTNDTPKYNVSQYFNNPTGTSTLSDKIYISASPNLYSPSTITVGFWFKKEAITRGGLFTTGPATTSSTTLAIHDYDSGVKVISSDNTTLSMGHYDTFIPSTNIWYYYVITFDGINAKIYINGDLKTTKSYSEAKTLQNIIDITLGANSAGGVYRSAKGYYSDFRIYATALSADDVKSLYQNSAYIDSSGNVYGAVHTEA